MSDDSSAPSSDETTNRAGRREPGAADTQPLDIAALPEDARLVHVDDEPPSVLLDSHSAVLVRP